MESMLCACYRESMLFSSPKRPAAASRWQYMRPPSQLVFWGLRCWPFICQLHWPAQPPSLSFSGWPTPFWKGRRKLETEPLAGLTVAGVGAGQLAASIGQIFLARGGFRANFLPLILSLSLALLWWAWGQPNRRRITWFGLRWQVPARPSAVYLYSSPRHTFHFPPTGPEFPDSIRP